MTWRCVWITGASSGIGRELALRVAHTGARVAASARTATALEDLARLDPLISAYPVDVTNTADMIATAKRIEADIGPIDLTIFNAGIWKPMGASRLSAEAAQQSMAVNSTAASSTGSKPVLPAMIAREAGHVALVSSVAGSAGLPKGAAYGPTKAAVINLAESPAPRSRAQERAGLAHLPRLRRYAHDPREHLPHAVHDTGGRSRQPHRSRLRGSRASRSPSRGRWGF